MKSHRKKYIFLWCIPILACPAAAVFFLVRGSTPGGLSLPSINVTFGDPNRANPETTASSDENGDTDSSSIVSEGSDSLELQDQSATPPLLSSPSAAVDYAITELKTQGDLQILTGGSVSVVYYRQGDERWGQLLYGTDYISTHGCGPTAMAIVVSTLTDTVIDPPSMAQWAVEHGYWARRSGSYHSIVIGTARAFGLNAESFPSRDIDHLREQLLSGKLFVALMGPGHFTRGGHFIVLRGVTLSGDILVADPASEEHSLMVWDPQLLLDELSRSTNDGSPLWVISIPEAMTGA